MFIPNTHFWVRPIPGNWSMAVEFLTSLLSSVSINNSLKIHVYYIIIIILLTCLRKFVTYNELVLHIHLQGASLSFRFPPIKIIKSVHENNKFRIEINYYNPRDTGF